MNGLYQICSKVPIGLRAQLVRQSKMTVFDNLWGILNSKGVKGYEMLTLNDEVKVVAQMDSVTYKRIAGMRSCFIAQVDLWHSFLKPLYDKHGWLGLVPCKGKCDQCPVKVEALDARMRWDNGKGKADFIKHLIALNGTGASPLPWNGFNSADKLPEGYAALMGLDRNGLDEALVVVPIATTATPPCPIFEKDMFFFNIRAENAIYPEVYEGIRNPVTDAVRQSLQAAE
jgi:hypothetical protein